MGPDLSLRNLSDLVLRREPPPLLLTAKPVPLRPDYFIRTGIGSKPFAESYGLHILVIVAVYLAFTLSLFRRSKLQSPLENTRVEYYPPVSEYLPPINTG